MPVLNPASRSHDYVTQYRYQKNKMIIERCKLSDWSQALIHCQRLDKAKLEVLSFETDTFGQIIAEENHGGLYRYDYDPLGNLLTTYLPECHQLNAHYYGPGHLSQLNYITNSGERHILAEYERDRLHREVRRTQGKLHQDIAFDSTGRITAKRCRISTISFSAPLIEKQFVYDKADNLTQQVNGYGDYPQPLTPAPRYTERYEYDKSGHILLAQSNILTMTANTVESV